MNSSYKNMDDEESIEKSLDIKQILEYQLQQGGDPEINYNFDKQKVYEIFSDDKIYNKYMKSKYIIYQQLMDKSYFLESYLTSGGEGDLFDGYLINNFGIKQECVFKICFNASEKQFNKETTILKSIEPINIIKIIDSIKINTNIKDKYYYIHIFEKCQSDLTQIIKKNLNEQQFLSIFMQCVDALIQLRMYYIIHGDIKNSNFLLTNEGRCYLADFGLAQKKIAGYMVKYLGKTKKIAPKEQKIGSKSIYFHSDVYSLGFALMDLINQFENSNQNLSEQMKNLLIKFKNIIQQNMQQQSFEKRSACLEIHKLFFEQLNKKEYIEFHKLYLKKIQKIIDFFPYDPNIDIPFFKKQQLHYLKIFLSMQKLTQCENKKIANTLEKLGNYSQNFGDNQSYLRYKHQSNTIRSQISQNNKIHCQMLNNKTESSSLLFEQSTLSLNYSLINIIMKENIQKDHSNNNALTNSIQNKKQQILIQDILNHLTKNIYWFNIKKKQINYNLNQIKSICNGERQKYSLKNWEENSNSKIYLNHEKENLLIDFLISKYIMYDRQRFYLQLIKQQNYFLLFYCSMDESNLRFSYQYFNMEQYLMNKIKILKDSQFYITDLLYCMAQSHNRIEEQQLILETFNQNLYKRKQILGKNKYKIKRLKRQLGKFFIRFWNFQKYQQDQQFKSTISETNQLKIIPLQDKQDITSYIQSFSNNETIQTLNNNFQEGQSIVEEVQQKEEFEDLADTSINKHEQETKFNKDKIFNLLNDPKQVKSLDTNDINTLIESKNSYIQAVISSFHSQISKNSYLSSVSLIDLYYQKTFKKQILKRQDFTCNAQYETMNYHQRQLTIKSFDTKTLQHIINTIQLTYTYDKQTNHQTKISEILGINKKRKLINNDNKLQIQKVLKDQNYILQKYLDSGGSSECYLGQHFNTQYNNQDCVFKIIQSNKKQDQEEQEEFDNEVSILKSFENYFNIVKFIDSFHIKDYKYNIIVLEKCQYSLKNELKDMIEKKIPFKFKQLLKIMFDNMDVLNQLRIHNIFHSDIKPGNILKKQSGIYCISDFGISCQLKNEYDHFQPKGFTKSYAPIELIQQTNIGYHCDIFSMGKTFLEVIKVFETVNLDLSVQQTKTIEKFKHIINTYMINKNYLKRKECLEIHNLLFQNSIHYEKFLQPYLEQIENTLNMSYKKNINFKYFWQQRLHYLKIKLQLIENDETKIHSTMICNKEISLCYENIGDYQKSLKILLKSLEIAILKFSEDYSLIADLQQKVAKLYSTLGDFQMAQYYQLESTDTKEKVLIKNYANKNNDNSQQLEYPQCCNDSDDLLNNSKNIQKSINNKLNESDADTILQNQFEINNNSYESLNNVQNSQKSIKNDMNQKENICLSLNHQEQFQNDVDLQNNDQNLKQLIKNEKKQNNIDNLSQKQLGYNFNDDELQNKDQSSLLLAKNNLIILVIVVIIKYGIRVLIEHSLNAIKNYLIYILFSYCIKFQIQKQNQIFFDTHNLNQNQIDNLQPKELEQFSNAGSQQNNQQSFTQSIKHIANYNSESLNSKQTGFELKTNYLQNKDLNSKKSTQDNIKMDCDNNLPQKELKDSDDVVNLLNNDQNLEQSIKNENNQNGIDNLQQKQTDLNQNVSQYQNNDQISQSTIKNYGKADKLLKNQLEEIQKNNGDLKNSNGDLQKDDESIKQSIKNDINQNDNNFQTKQVGKKQFTSELSNNFQTIQFNKNDICQNGIDTQNQKKDFYIYYNTGEIQNKDKNVQKSIIGLQETFNDDDSEIMKCQNQISQMAYDKGDYENSLKYLQQNLRMMRNSKQEDGIDMVYLQYNLGVVYHLLCDHTNALEQFRSSLKKAKKFFEGNHYFIASLFDRIGVINLNLDIIDKGNKYCQKSLEMNQALDKGNNIGVVYSLNSKGFYYEKIGDKYNAEKYYQESLKMSIYLFNKKHPQTIACLTHLGQFYFKSGDNDKALKYFLNSFEEAKQYYECNNHVTATLLNQIANIYAINNQLKNGYKCSESLYKQEKIITIKTTLILFSL